MPPPSAASRAGRRPTPARARLDDIVTSTATLLEQHAALIAASRRPVPLDRCGYHLDGVLAGDELDLVRLLIGSEGTLGLFTAGGADGAVAGRAGGAAVRLRPAGHGARAARLAVPTGPTGCELLERRLLRLARGEPAYADLIPEDAEAVLLVEYEADTPADARRLADDLVDRLYRRDRLAVRAAVAREGDEADLLGITHRGG
ncbi:MAG: FAD-linked oxidase C-terminal domain-containing protein [Gemmataceae bacterium]